MTTDVDVLELVDPRFPVRGTHGARGQLPGGSGGYFAPPGFEPFWAIRNTPTSSRSQTALVLQHRGSAASCG
jgi:hypothetical protein